PDAGDGAWTAPVPGQPEFRVAQDKAVAAIESLGGTAEVDASSPDRPVLKVNLEGKEVTDSQLEPLKGLSRLQTLSLARTGMSDAGLAILEYLPSLQRLDLAGTRVSDAGLKHLRKLTQLRDLDLGLTDTTSAGLSYLEGLEQLQRLDLRWTGVDDTG